VWDSLSESWRQSLEGTLRDTYADLFRPTLHIGDHPVDWMLFALVASALMADMDDDLRYRSLAWGVNRWQQYMADHWPPPGGAAPPPPGRPSMARPSPPSRPPTHVEITPPPQLPPPGGGGAGGGPPKPPAPPPPPGGGPPTPPIPSPPPRLPEHVREAWIQARMRAGEYARGLGNKIGEDLETIERELWEGEEVVHVPEEEAREEARRTIEEKTAEAVAEPRDARWLASRLGQARKDWARNWRRIAETELQAAHNEGIALEAYREDGAEARIVRVPNDDACPDCLRLYLDDDGVPRIFSVLDIVANGTNVGKKRADWQPTLFPLHPHCRCYTIRVPRGVTRVDRYGSPEV